MTTRHRFTVPEKLDGDRLDSTLAALGDGWTRTRCRRLIDGGHVRLNDRAAKPSTAVRAGDRVDVLEPPPRKLAVEAEELPLDIVHEDADLLVLNKPADLVIHPAAGRSGGTLVNALLHHCDDLSGIGGVERPGIVHRLDRDTSGVMVVAKSERAHVALALAFRRREVSKTYLAVCYGTPPRAETVIDAPIARHPRERKQMAVVQSGRPSRTLVTVEERLAGTALVACRPITGRTHQIRVHMAHIGHALVGDPLYAGRQWRNIVGGAQRAACRDFPRQALHAWRLAFRHPVTGVDCVFEARPPADLAALIAVLRL